MRLTSSHRALVTGAAGFIGTHLTQALLAANTHVTAIDRRPLPLPDAPNLVRITGDLTTCPLEPLLADTDTVFHLAATPGVRPSWGPDFDTYLATNLHATHRLMTAAARAGVPRLILASSSSVYGPTDGTPSSENDPPHPASPYAVTKLAAEHLCLAHASQPHCPTTVTALRYFTVYGPGQRPDMLIHRALASALTGEPLPIYGDGTQQRDFTYIGDAIRATISAATAPAANTIVNVGSGTPTTISDVLHIVGEIVGRPASTSRVQPAPGDVPTTHADLTRAKELLEWTPETTPHTGISEQLRYFLHEDPDERPTPRASTTL